MGLANDLTADLIRKHEGLSLKVYYDTEGIPTVGYGHALQIGSRIPISVAERLFWQDYKTALEDYDKLNLDLSEIRKGVLVNMLFNMGLPRLLGFKKMLAALREKDYRKATSEMINSKWYRQTKSRAIELKEIMRTGEYL